MISKLWISEYVKSLWNLYKFKKIVFSVFILLSKDNYKIPIKKIFRQSSIYESSYKSMKKNNLLMIIEKRFIFFSEIKRALHLRKKIEEN